MGLGLQKLIALAVVAVVGVTMAAMGASRDSFMGLVLAGAGVFLVVATNRYRVNPTYTDANGKQQTVGPAMLIFMAVLAVLLVAAGLFVGIHGLE